MNKMNLKIGDYIICRYKGESGDLLAGRVVTLHRDGKVTSSNLLNGGESTRHIDVLYRRNLVVPKAAAMEVVAVFEKTKDKQKARAKAVELATLATQSAASSDAPAPVKRGPGRPRKTEPATAATNGNGNGHKTKGKPGRKPGRPRKEVTVKELAREAAKAGAHVEFNFEKKLTAKEHGAVVGWLKGALKGMQKHQPSA